MAWACNRFVDAKTVAELCRKIAQLEAQGWRLVEVNENGFCAYLERGKGIGGIPKNPFSSPETAPNSQKQAPAQPLNALPLRLQGVSRCL